MGWLNSAQYSTTPDWDSVKYTQMEKRVAKMGNYELLEWADVAGSGMAKAFSDLRKENSQDTILEIQEGLQALWALTRELSLRGQAGV